MRLLLRIANFIRNRILFSLKGMVGSYVYVVYVYSRCKYRISRTKNFHCYAVLCKPLTNVCCHHRAKEAKIFHVLSVAFSRSLTMNFIDRYLLKTIFKKG